MSDLLPEFQRLLAERHLLKSRERVLLAVSGGVDSMVLLDLFRRAYEKFPKRLVVAHFNHRLRGASSSADERFVRRVAEDCGLNCVTSGCAVKDFARTQKLSVEMAARQLRHEFLAATARRLSIRSVVLAHHADDQVELFFLRLLRGASPAGLAGMKWCAASPADARVRLVRPLLGFGKAQLAAYARERGVAFREDATNREPEFLRNRIRGELLPLLRRHYQPGLNDVVLRVMGLLGAETELVQLAAAKWRAGGGGPFEQLPVAVQRSLLERELVNVSAVPEFGLIEQLRLRPHLPVTIAPGEGIERDDQGRLHRRKLVAHAFRGDEVVVDLELKSSAKLGDVGLDWEVVSPAAARRALRTAARRTGAGRGEFFDADKIGRRIVLRHWRAGDVFHPIGMSGPVKLQDWFVNRKVPRARRHELVVAVATNGKIFWVEGQRISEAFKLDNTTTRSLKWCWSPP